jgi:hypothetical protein
MKNNSLFSDMLDLLKNTSPGGYPDAGPNDRMNEFLRQGTANKNSFTRDDAAAKELAAGIDIESEHTDDPTIAEKIALDHLAEIPDYYSRLAAMETEAKKAMGA